MLNHKKILYVIVAGLFIFSCAKNTKPYRAPYFECKGIDGKTYTLYNYKGKRLLLIFWATWCPTCKKELSRVIANLNKLRENKIEILAVSLDTNLDSVKKSVIEHGLTGIPVAIVSKQMTMDYQGVRFLPTAFLINEKGYIVKKLVGELDPEEIIKAFKAKPKKS